MNKGCGCIRGWLKIDDDRNAGCKHNGDIVQLNRDLSSLDTKIDYIIKAVDELRLCQTSLNTCMGTLQVDIAERPSKERLEKGLDKIEKLMNITSKHTTYFMFISVAVLIIITWLSGILGDLTKIFLHI